MATEVNPASDARRLFVGVRVSVACANTLAGVAETLARRARDGGFAVGWVAPVSYHVTLKFLGWTREAAIGAVRDAITAAVQAAPELPRELKFRCAKLGGFPAIERASVVWAGVEEPGAAAIGELARRIELATMAIGYAANEHPFHPHVTLGRLREPRPIRELILPVSEQMFSETRADGVILYESETKPSGSVYRELSRIPFKPPAGAPFQGAERQTPPVQLGATDAAVPRSSAPTASSISGEPETDDGWPRGQGP